MTASDIWAWLSAVMVGTAGGLLAGIAARNLIRAHYRRKRAAKAARGIIVCPIPDCEWIATISNSTDISTRIAIFANHTQTTHSKGADQ